MPGGRGSTPSTRWRREFPEHRPLIEAYRSALAARRSATRSTGTVDVLADLRDAGVRLLALSNWSAETFPVALERYPFLGWFEGIVISGEVGAAKPDERIFRGADRASRHRARRDRLRRRHASRTSRLRRSSGSSACASTTRTGCGRTSCAWAYSGRAAATIRRPEERADGLDRRQRPAPGGHDRLHRRAAVPYANASRHRRRRCLQHQPDGSSGSIPGPTSTRPSISSRAVRPRRPSPLDALIGPAWVVDAAAARGRSRPRTSTASTSRRTRSGCCSGRGARTCGTRRRFEPGFVALDATAAAALVRRGVRPVGMDYLSIAPFGDPVAHAPDPVRGRRRRARGARPAEQWRRGRTSCCACHSGSSAATARRPARFLRRRG